MIRKMIAAIAIAGIISATPALAANQCRDAKGKFIKCPDAAKKPAAASVAKGKDGKCRYTSGTNKGKFAKCP
ncbi:hypothetical protein EDF56_11727 [Novosphingobium sp. PhB165]|uniref:hypothetical protein n=1 Tax=Novosphingobium sp. PhB165 TaxID=2485105 RepID=UPI001049D933|nr:hypothetical protein [Novosphingobium sp. PhB165]TCM12863.1 hypothetical protein EDF56_11727 [Novosphingobium sp. PhB165]